MNVAGVKQFLKGIPIVEKILFVVFAFYLVFQVATPLWLVPLINSSLGLVVVFLIVIYLFCYTTPVLGVLSIFVAYELLRRSAVMPLAKAQIESRAPSQKKKDAHLAKLNPPTNQKSLEEEIVGTMAPIGVSEVNNPEPTSYQPTNSTASFAGSLV